MDESYLPSFFFYLCLLMDPGWKSQLATNLRQLLVGAKRGSCESHPYLGLGRLATLSSPGRQRSCGHRWYRWRARPLASHLRTHTHTQTRIPN